MMVLSKVPEHDEIFRKFPGVPDSYDYDLNTLFSNFLFYDKKGSIKTFLCTECYAEFDVPSRVYPPELRKVKHGDTAACPFCGRELEVKSVGVCRAMYNLDQFRRALVILPTDNSELVFGAAIQVRKCFSGENYKKLTLVKKVEAVYAWTPGKAYCWLGRGRMIDGDWKTRYEETVSPSAVVPSNNYYVAFFGAGRLSETFLKYSEVEWLRDGQRTSGEDAVRWLAEYCVHPGIEMLIKMGHCEIVRETLLFGERGDGLLRWGADKPWKFYRMDKTEYKAFAAREPTISRLDMRRTLKKLWRGLDITDVDDIFDRYAVGTYRVTRLTEYERIAERLAPLISRTKLENYVDKNTPNGSGRYQTLILLKDYYDLAEKLGYDLNEMTVLLPKNLRAAHDLAVETMNTIKLREEAERLKKDEGTYRRRKKKLEKLYAYKSDGYIVRIPDGGLEIIAEGKALHHCVGGYAARHLRGEATILFIRREDDPDTPFFTVEMGTEKSMMSGVDQIKQIHGLRDCNPDEKLNLFVGKWLTEVRNRINERRNKDESKTA